MNNDSSVNSDKSHSTETVHKLIEIKEKSKRRRDLRRFLKTSRGRTVVQPVLDQAHCTTRQVHRLYNTSCWSLLIVGSAVFVALSPGRSNSHLSCLSPHTTINQSTYLSEYNSSHSGWLPCTGGAYNITTL